MGFKLVSWNLEHAQQLISSQPSATTLNRRTRIQATVEEMAPDVLCVIEGPKGEQAALDFASFVLGSGWSPVFIDAQAPVGVNDKKYQQKGTQWVWFFAKDAWMAKARIQDPAIWQAFTGKKSWPVHLFGQIAPKEHSHYRHPQVLILDVGGAKVEIIGTHLKSKINQNPVQWQNGNLVGAYLDEAIEARIKLTTEAWNVREYVDAKFAQVPHPGLVICGDCNDGPGRDYFERQYLYFDLIGNLQGEVLFAERFFNHALFDFKPELRWTAKYADDIDKIPASKNPLLIDHIMMSQPLCKGLLPVKVEAGAGKVEHEAFERHNAGSTSKTRTSDHRPVSCVFSD